MGKGSNPVSLKLPPKNEEIPRDLERAGQDPAQVDLMQWLEAEEDEWAHKAREEEKASNQEALHMVQEQLEEDT